jgi:LacI family transcriptional regulator
MTDVARHAGVAQSTASAVLNGKSGKYAVTPVKAAAVLRAAEELGFEPNHAARTLVTGRSRVIALQIYDLENPFQQQVARRLWALLGEDDYMLIVYEVQSDSGRLRSSADGAFVTAPGDMSAFTGKPVVQLGSRATNPIGSVVVDLKSAASEALAHLVATGRRRIALIAHRDDSRVDSIAAAYSEAVASAGLPTIYIPVGEERANTGYEALSGYLKGNDAPDAVLCRNDLLAFGCYKALAEAGLQVPSDVAVVGCDGIEIADYLRPSLSTIVQPVDDMCAVGWTHLKQMLDDPTQVVKPVTLQARFVRRESC